MSSAPGVNRNGAAILQPAAETPNVNVRPAPARKVVSQTRVSVGPDLTEIKRAISTLFNKNQTVETRVFDKRKKPIISGYYRDTEKLAADIFRIAKRLDIATVYWTLQECDPALYSRSADAYLEHPSSTTNDHDIQRYRWLPIDCDPQRPEGICATDEEKKAAYEVALKVREYIRGFDVVDMSNSILADSGNGFHVLVPIDLENSTESKALIQQTLVALDQRFSTEVVKIDTSVFNPSRVCKIYGTVVRKGSDTEERPHRQARLIDVPSNLPIFSREALEAIAETAIAEPTSTSNSSNNLDGPELEKKSAKMEQFLAEAKIKHRERMDYMGGFKWQIEACPFNPDHAAPDSFVSVSKTGALGFHCSHDSCSKNKWREFREIAEKAIGHHFSFTHTQNPKVGAQTAYGPPPAEVSRPIKDEPVERVEILSEMACDIEAVPIEWLWEPYIQEDALNSFYSNPGGGKGFTNIDFIARLTTGSLFPNEESTERQPMNCVILAAEESSANTIVPRLRAAGADLNRVRIIHSIRYHGRHDKIEERLITFQQDMVAVKADLQRHPKERYLLIDPITNYVGDINFNQDGEVRPVLTMLAHLAEELKITISIIGHFNKNTNVANAMDKPGGGRAWVAVPRTAWGFFRNPTDRKQRMMVSLRLSNADEEGTGLTFQISDRTIGTKRNGKPWVVGGVDWEGKTERTADEMIASEHPEARRDSKGVEFLNKILKNGRRLATEVYGAAEEKGISERTLKRACGDIKVLKFKIVQLGWYWQHPDDTAPIPDSAGNLNREATERRRDQEPEPPTTCDSGVEAAF